MRFLLLMFVFMLSGCAALDIAKTALEAEPSGLSARTLLAGECGLFVWTADRAKTFTLFASEAEAALYKEGTEHGLTEKNPALPPAASREFIDVSGAAYTLTLLSPQKIDGGTRYKTGRLVSLDDEGWERVIPIVGLYACQPRI